MKRVIILFIVFSGSLMQVTPAMANSSRRINDEQEDTLGKYAHYKNIPAAFRLPILKALSFFPELINIHIDFVVKKAYTPLTTKPTFGSLFKGKRFRAYVITISSQSIDTLSHLLYKNLSFDEQVGIMGHELSHVVDFDSKNFIHTLYNGAGHISGRFLDKMEYRTDLICINHGLGKYLEAYSVHVRNSMHVQYWRGVDHVFDKNSRTERYMNPQTIEKYMQVAAVHHS